EVELELLGIVLDEAEQVVRTAFLLPLNHHGDGKRQLARDGLERATSFHEGHHLAFVVAGTPRDDDLAAVRQRRDARRKRRRLPKIERIDRLYVVMAIEENARAFVPGTALAHHDRMSTRRPNTSLKAHSRQVLRHIFGSGLTLVLVGGVRRNGLDAQEFE